MPNKIDHCSESDSILQFGRCENHEWRSKRWSQDYCIIPWSTRNVLIKKTVAWCRIWCSVWYWRCTTIGKFRQFFSCSSIELTCDLSKILSFQIPKTCHHFVESFKYPDDPKFLFLRYEDMSMDPITTAIKVYEFINQPLPMKLFKWIEDSTKVKVSQLGLGYGTVKNSIQTMNAWRHRMTFEEVCPLVM